MNDDNPEKGLRRGLLDLATTGIGVAPKPSPDKLNALAGLLARKPEVIGVWYNRKRVKIDGYRFEGCRFDSCILEVTSTNFELIKCHVDPETTVEWGGQLIKVIQLFNANYPWVYGHAPSFAPRRNDDGTISIGR